MKGAIISNNPYHNNPSANLTNKELANKIDVKLSYDMENINEIVTKLDVDYIICWVNEDLWNIPSLHNYVDKVILASGDLPGRLKDRRFRNLCRYHKATGIILENKCHIPAFKEYLHKGEELDYYWYPWGIDEEYIKDYGFNKEYDVVQLGQFNKYQFRREIFGRLSNNKEISYFRFWPKRSHVTKKEEHPYNLYCKTYNKGRIGIGGCLQHPDFTYINDNFLGINFGKNIEIPGLRCALFNTDWGDRELLGFKDGENFVQFKDDKECINKINYYLDDLSELKRITDNGFKLVHEKHTNKIHVDMVMKEIDGN